MYSNTQIKTLTIDLGNKKEKIQVVFSKTLSQLRSENKWCDQDLIFVDSEDTVIEHENENDLTISEILVEKYMTIKMV